MEFKLGLDRLGQVLELDQFRVDEVLESGRCTFVSEKLYNKGVYRVRNRRTGLLEDIAIRITHIEAATYQQLVDEMGDGCVDPRLWDDLGEGEPMFFYAFTLETDLVDPEKRDQRIIEA